ncbi:nuclear transport factor 2 family protein [Pseudonocardia parietis]|uniref:Uncharacterized protein (TIGR02246 family) n=1 Tax=Pseudonocardia parietis TaxID=570936 RepID=A0ABS4VUT4_9PSEU|nr:nuclear transport factor 2 family protein [Pseudonocardia parietis]MBP2367679.1 uncharacterized protein (TIGR02246 family) [Pseudonocardia parietis]
MPADLSRIAVEAARLQNGYALAVDTRDWDYFATLFTPDVRAIYPGSDYRGMDDWLATFVPFHDACTWTLHVMTNHVVGEDENGIWAVCYGWIQWTHQDTPDQISRSAVLYRDRLRDDDGRWRIERRRLDLLLRDPGPIPVSLSLPHSVLDLRDPS